MNRIQSIRASVAKVTALPLSRHLARTTVALSALLACTAPAHAQAVYPTPDAAVAAFVDALATNDQAAMQQVLGKYYNRFIPSKDVGEEDIYEFLGAWAAGHRIIDDAAPLHGRPSKHLSVGTSGWTLPIPLVQAADGWRFDPAAGSDEILTRRIGRNEHAAIQTSLAYLDAQRDYRALAGHFAQRLISTPGKRDGLYWPTASGEAQSPLGPLAAAMPKIGSVSKQGYHGYHFRILTAQGPHAKGGPLDYLENGKLAKGYGLVAWPAEYGKTGVMSFIVNQDGQVYQKNLGYESSRRAAALRAFDPDRLWQAVEP